MAPEESLCDECRRIKRDKITAAVRQVLRDTVNWTAQKERYVTVDSLRGENSFEEYQQRVNEPVEQVVSHRVIDDYIRRFGEDYRFETAQNPIPDLRVRTVDNVRVGRV